MHCLEKAGNCSRLKCKICIATGRKAVLWVDIDGKLSEEIFAYSRKLFLRTKIGILALQWIMALDVNVPAISRSF